MRLRDLLATDFSRGNLRLSSFLVIAIITAGAYYPSLFHAARSDQITYLADMAGREGFFSLAVEPYALDRSREFLIGDDRLLFRPLLYFALGTERWLFGYDFFWWQLASLVLHLSVVWMLLKVLLDEDSGPLAPVMALFFSVQYVSMDMVIWHHLTGYLLFSFFLLGAIYNLRKYGDGPNRGGLLLASLAFAAFLHELGSVAAVLVAGHMALSNRFSKGRSRRYGRGVVAGAFAVPLAYAALSALDLYARFGDLSAFGRASAPEHAGTALKTAALVFLWPLAALDPAFISLKAFERVFLTIVTGLTPWGAMGIAAASVAAGSCITIWRETLTRESLKKDGFFHLLLFAFMLAYAAVIVVGRADIKGFWRTAAINSYYAYIFNLLGIVLLYSSLGTVRLKRRAFAAAGLAAGLLMAAGMSAASIYKLNVRMEAYSMPRIEFVGRVERLLREHPGEEGLTFSVSENCRGIDITAEGRRALKENYAVSWPANRKGNDVLWIKRRGDSPEKTYTLAEALYPRQYVPEGGKYEVSCAP